MSGYTGKSISADLTRQEIFAHRMTETVFDCSVGGHFGIRLKRQALTLLKSKEPLII